MLLPIRRRADLPERSVKRVSALEAGVTSALIPGGGQLWQRRYGAAVVQFTTFVAYGLAALRFGGAGWALGALVVNIWSCIDASWWARGSGEDPDPAPQDRVTESR